MNESSSPQVRRNDWLDRLLAWLAQPGWEPDVIILLVIGAITCLVFSNGLGGGFVYDDSKQILLSPLVRDPDYFWQAMTQDVWSFKVGGDEASSDYWRPVFMLWLIVNHRLWGVDSAVGWHSLNLLLHVAVLVVAYGVLRQLGVSRLFAAAILTLFAIHPTHVESVTWISGSPDMLVALFVLGSWWCVLVGRARRQWGWFAAATVLFFLSLLAKEVGLFYPVLVFLTLFWLERGTMRQRFLLAGKGAVPFAAAATLYFIMRLAVLGQFATAKGWVVSNASLLLTQPSLIFFYLRQSLLPVRLGPSYAVRAVTPDNLGVANFILPLVSVLLLAVLVAVLLSSLRQSEPTSARQIGLGLTFFLVFLLPVLSFRHFIPEHIVHDRYLYLPLLGLLLALVVTGGAVVSLVREKVEPRQAGWIGLGAVLLCLPLSVQTIRYNTAWRTDLSLWAWGVETDPTSLFNWNQYTYFLRTDGQNEAAFAAAQTIINRQPSLDSFYVYLQVVNAYLEQVDVQLAQGQLAEAEQILTRIFTSVPIPTNEYEAIALENILQRAYERLSLRFQHSDEMPLAIEALVRGREAVPGKACTFTVNLAVLLYLEGQKEAAFGELEQVRGRVPQEYTPICTAAYFYLAQLYTELGRHDDARDAWQNYLDFSQTFYDGRTQTLRATSLEMISQSGPP